MKKIVLAISVLILICGCGRKNDTTTEVMNNIELQPVQNEEITTLNNDGIQTELPSNIETGNSNVVKAKTDIEIVELSKYEYSKKFDNGSECEADITKFEIRNLNNKDLQDRLNTLFKEKANYYEEEFKEFLKSDEVVNGTFSHPYGQYNRYEYRIIDNNDDVFSFMVGEQAGRLIEQTYYNINKKSGKLLSLEDFYGKHDRYLDYIAYYIVNQAKERNKVEDLYDFATFDNIRDSLNNFYINDKGKVVIVFSEYQIAKGAAGCVEFELDDEKILSASINDINNMAEQSVLYEALINDK